MLKIILLFYFIVLNFSHVFALEKSLKKNWEELIEADGCLISATDIRFSTEGSVFRKKTWQSFIDRARKNKAVFEYILSRFPSEQATKIHICNFENATEGLLAVFVVQQIIHRNWYSYDGNDSIIIAERDKKVFPLYKGLKKILSNKEACSQLQSYFLKQYCNSPLTVTGEKLNGASKISK